MYQGIESVFYVLSFKLGITSLKNIVLIYFYKFYYFFITEEIDYLGTIQFSATKYGNRDIIPIRIELFY